MTPDQFNSFCASLPHSTHVVQWGGAQVWKLGGKLFAAMWDGHVPNAGITFKVTPLAFELLRDQPGLRPAPYLASRGMKWIQRVSAASMSDDELMLYLRQSYELALERLTRAQRQALTSSPAP
ncbi:MAG: MmcQ/YjbR family DNA-binding protein [Alphaproteobacteria bacterium]|nr:MmcQ/YjbR family DNA-binding protein [Alphaproteobacteria bacterium]